MSWPFDEAGRRKVNGGPKATAADEITWVGIWRGRRWRLVSRPRLIQPLESFVTSSGHRLRDSHVGRSGHWIDLVVHEPLAVAEAELAELERMAGSVDPRPAQARLKRRKEVLTSVANLLV